MKQVPDGFDPADWKAAPHRPWAFRNVERFLPTARVTAATTPRLLSARTSDAEWGDCLDAIHATSALAIRHGALSLETYRQGMTGHDRHTLFSITKSIVGLAALILVDGGAVHLEKSAAHYVPELAGTAFGRATLGELLDMRDGMPFGEDYADARAEIHTYSRHYWGETQGGTLSALASLSRRIQHPGRFAYRTPVADVIGWILRRATGCSLTSLISELIWKPIGAEADALMILDTAGVEIAGTGFTARPRDLARLALALLDRDGSPFPESVVARLFAGGDRPAFAKAGYKTRQAWSYTGLFWHLGGARLGALGVHGQRLLIDRDAGTALIITAAVPTPDTRHLDELYVEMLKRLSRGVFGSFPMQRSLCHYGLGAGNGS